LHGTWETQLTDLTKASAFFILRRGKRELKYKTLANREGQQAGKIK